MVYTNPTPTQQIFQQGSTYTHVVVIALHGLHVTDVIGNPVAPYMNQLANRCAQGLDYNSVEQANPLSNEMDYVTGGSPSGVNDNLVATGNNYPGVLSIANQVKPKFWKSARYYEESMTSVCQLKSSTDGEYQTIHNPPAYLPDSKCTVVATTGNQYDAVMGTSTSGQLLDDMTKSPAAFSYIQPDASNDGSHGVAAADTFVRTWVSMITKTQSYISGNEVIFIAGFDAPGASPGAQCTMNTEVDDCNLPLIAVDPYIKPGTRDPHCYNHFSLLRTSEEIWGVPYLGHAGDSSTLSMYANMGL